MTRLGYVLATVFAADVFVILFGAVAWFAPQPRLVWNASASAPTGLYRLARADTVRIGDLVALPAPAAQARMMAARHYLPLGVPLLKHVAAVTGARVCRRAGSITIDGRWAAVAKRQDRKGRPLPVWRGCRTLGEGELFVLNAPADSFDSRYFGAVEMRDLLGRASPVLTRDAPGTPLQWRGLGAAHWESAGPPGFPSSGPFASDTSSSGASPMSASASAPAFSLPCPRR